MDQFYFDLADATDWIWKNRNKPQFWEWEDLTSNNPDKSNLNLSNAVAWNVFTVLESKGLLHEFFTTRDNKEIRVFKIDLSDEKLWKKTRKRPYFWRRWITEPICWLFSKFWYFILWTISVSLAAFLTSSMDKWVSLLFPQK
ncbi:MAG: hypothetical protein WC437_05535 [Patescibacteria group bacterium]